MITPTSPTAAEQGPAFRRVARPRRRVRDPQPVGRRQRSDPGAARVRGARHDRCRPRLLRRPHGRVHRSGRDARPTSHRSPLPPTFPCRPISRTDSAPRRMRWRRRSPPPRRVASSADRSRTATTATTRSAPCSTSTVPPTGSVPPPRLLAPCRSHSPSPPAASASSSGVPTSTRRSGACRHTRRPEPTCSTRPACRQEPRSPRSRRPSIGPSTW